MNDISRILVFDIKGFMAHFRKYYTNSSALTYSFPPYTTIVGLIAGILGRERDSYYEEFSSKNCQIGLSIKDEARKIIQTMNFIRTKNKNEFDGSAGPTPTPMEILLSKGAKLKYRLYFSHKDENLMEELKFRIQNHRYVYPPYLGISEFLAELEYVDDISQESINAISSENVVMINTAINTEFIKDKGIIFEKAKTNLKLYKEKMPLEFGKNRVLKKVGSFVFEGSGKSVPVLLNIPYYQIDSNDEGINILFLNQRGDY